MGNSYLFLIYNEQEFRFETKKNKPHSKIREQKVYHYVAYLIYTMDLVGGQGCPDTKTGKWSKHIQRIRVSVLQSSHQTRKSVLQVVLLIKNLLG